MWTGASMLLPQYAPKAGLLPTYWLKPCLTTFGPFTLVNQCAGWPRPSLATTLPELLMVALFDGWSPCLEIPLCPYLLRFGARQCGNRGGKFCLCSVALALQFFGTVEFDLTLRNQRFGLLKGHVVVGRINPHQHLIGLKNTPGYKLGGDAGNGA